MPNLYVKEVKGWGRPKEIYGKEPTLWGDKGVQPNGVNQSRLGDCWFLASAAALAEYPDRIMDLFTNTEYSASGAFQVKFYRMTEPVHITVDDRFAYDIGQDKRYTSYGKKWAVNSGPGDNGGWWLPILEKAYAKFNVNYGNLNGGDPGVAFRDLTAKPVMNIKTKDLSGEEFFKIASEAD
jgi:hypothetical protein